MRLINMIRYFTYLVIVDLLISCNRNQQDCFHGNFKELNLWPVGATVKLPPYKIIDSVKFGYETLMSYRIKSNDSLLDMNVFVIEEKNQRPPHSVRAT